MLLRRSRIRRLRARNMDSLSVVHWITERTFFFFAFEQRRRNESGFFTSNVAQG